MHRPIATVLYAMLIFVVACGAPGGQPGGNAGADPAAAGSPSGAASGDAAARGKYLATIMGCGDCHTPLKMTPQGPAPDETMLFAGHPATLAMPPAPALPAGSPWLWIGAGTNTAFSGPWGISYSPNITPDEVTGIGAWTEEIFVNTMRTGKHWGQSRPILPPMPWPGYSQMTDEDLRAVYAYLRTLPPISNQAPASIPAEAPAAPAAH